MGNAKNMIFSWTLLLTLSSNYYHVFEIDEQILPPSLFSVPQRPISFYSSEALLDLLNTWWLRTTTITRYPLPSGSVGTLDRVGGNDLTALYDLRGLSRKARRLGAGVIWCWYWPSSENLAELLGSWLQQSHVASPCGLGFLTTGGIVSKSKHPKSQVGTVSFMWPNLRSHMVSLPSSFMDQGKCQLPPRFKGRALRSHFWGEECLLHWKKGMWDEINV